MRRPIPFLALILPSLICVSAGPLPRNAAHDYNGAGYLLPRACEGGYCGYDDAFCCGSGQICYTDAQTIARCGAATALAAVDGGWAYYTTTYIETVENPVTKVEIFSSYLGNVAVPSQYIAQSTAICAANQIHCGAICCSGSQVCFTDGDCRDSNGPSGTIASSYLTPVVPATSYIPPVKGTSVTVTTVPITTTQPFVAPVQTTGGSLVPLVPVTEGGGLSPGAIAGIVIGTIAAIIILLLLLACCLLGTGIKGLFALLGGKKKTHSRSSSPRGHRTESYEYRRTTQRVGGAAAGARYSGGSRWFGGGAAPPPVGRRTTVTKTTQKKKTGLGKEAAVAGLGLGAMWAGLRWKRKRDGEKRRPQSSYYESSRYTGSTTETARSVPRTHRTPRSGTARTGTSRR